MFDLFLKCATPKLLCWAVCTLLMFSVLLWDIPRDGAALLQTLLGHGGHRDGVRLGLSITTWRDAAEQRGQKMGITQGDTFLLPPSNKYGKNASPPHLSAPPGASTGQQKELQLLPHRLHPLEFPSLVQPYFREVSLCVSMAWVHILVFSLLVLCLFGQCLTWCISSRIKFPP